MCFHTTHIFSICEYGAEFLILAQNKKARSIIFEYELRRQVGDVVKQQTVLEREEVGQTVMGSAIETGEGGRELGGGCAEEAKPAAELF